MPRSDHAQDRVSRRRRVGRYEVGQRALPLDPGQHAFYGFECENIGDGEDPWPAAQLGAVEKASAALCRIRGWTERSVVGHLEWQPGKVDPRGFSMSWLRQRIAARLAQRSHTVRPGEHLASIGAMYGVRWPDIARANGLTSPYRVYPGRVLKIPEK